MTADVADLLEEMLARARPRAGLHQGDEIPDAGTAERLILEARWELLRLGVEGPGPGFTLGQWAIALEMLGDHVDRMAAHLRARTESTP